jgi:hypothetical protein
MTTRPLRGPSPTTPMQSRHLTLAAGLTPCRGRSGMRRLWSRPPRPTCGRTCPRMGVGPARHSPHAHRDAGAQRAPRAASQIDEAPHRLRSASVFAITNKGPRAAITSHFPIPSRLPRSQDNYRTKTLALDARWTPRPANLSWPGCALRRRSFRWSTPTHHIDGAGRAV